MLKRVYYPVNKKAIEESIKLYLKYRENGSTWEEFYYSCDKICPGSNAWAVITAMFQPMFWSKSLTVDNVYYAILAMGVNTKMEEVV